MTRPELGTKRLCGHCGAKFYDLHHSPITCPKCGTVLATPDVNSSRNRPKPGREPAREIPRPISETSGEQFAPPKDSSGGADGEEEAGVLPEVDDDDDEELDDAVLIEDSDQDDDDVADVRRKEVD
jgi:uncharacterized protein (TIGR02300 family)